VFFCNSGTEANEGAFKFARRAFGARPEKREIVALKGAFHGRTMGALAATDRAAYREPFGPLVPGVQIVDPHDDAALERAVSAQRTAAVIAEPIQGEGGINMLPSSLLQELRALCDEADAALILDEIQCGMGRTGSLFAYQRAGVVPDMVTIAKAFGAGLPMGAILVNQRIADALQPGDHGTTFGGGPFVASVALAQFNLISRPEFLRDVRRLGEWLERRLSELTARHATVKAVRGVGLIWGVELTEPVQPVIQRALERHLLLIAAGTHVIRLLPPLVISEEELQRGLAILEECL
ncbi:MAG TPA: aminotransferase class III-fold pyridoxal phosphate-dependent enzyme, partial [Gemmatimonadales bacterium]|nr:aminotransferase class III-fold pyridoxal phosphate-dependent enzyme [Gemmatimonadales bacterium]